MVQTPALNSVFLGSSAMTLCDGLTKFARRCESYGPEFPHGDLEVTKEGAVGLLPLMCCSAKRDRLNQWVIAAAAVRCHLEGGEIDWQDLEDNLAIRGPRSCSHKPFWMLFKQHFQSLQQARELQCHISTSQRILDTYDAFEELGDMKEDLKAIFADAYALLTACIDDATTEHMPMH